MKFYKLSILPLPFTKIILFRQQPLLLLRFLSSLASIRKQPFSFDLSHFQVEDPSIPPSQSVLASCFLSALHCAAKRQWNRETVAVSKADTREEDGLGRREMKMLRNVITQSLMSARI
ncbi:hypothetical protein LWI29_017126 [Acer saccharum]|uniref:Uncharacterized protein n=1 Tax=Acer saccharum TaxID=4024 RepID=A0AA39RX09_ACESA|nr:hypothetical protein LWI29_017126 [Acer saccharum]